MNNLLMATLSALNANPHMTNKQLYELLLTQSKKQKTLRVPGTLPGAVFATARRVLGITAPTGRQGGPAHIDVKVWEAAARENNLPFTQPPAPGEVSQPTERQAIVPATTLSPVEAGDIREMRTKVADLQQAMAALGITKLVVTQRKFEVTRTYIA